MEKNIPRIYKIKDCGQNLVIKIHFYLEFLINYTILERGY